MHSRKRRTEQIPQEEIDRQNERKEKIVRLHMKVFDFRDQQNFTEEALQITAKAISLSPDVESFFSYRRRIIQSLIEADQDIAQNLYKRELDFMTRLIKESLKSYTLWFHRMWVLKQWNNQEAISNDIRMCEFMLDKDNRNFHCWNYRIWLVNFSGNLTYDEEMVFTESMILKDFSNYSAWHYRTKILKKEYQNEIPISIIQTELRDLQNGYFTCPDDQSIWNYYKWIMSQWISIKPTGFVLQEDGILVGFTHSIAGLDENSLAVASGWESLDGTWQPVLSAPYSYFWKFVYKNKPTNTDNLEIRFNKYNEKLTDITGFKKLTEYNYKLSQGKWKMEGQDDFQLIRDELMNINNLLEIENDAVTQSLLMKAHLLENLVLYNTTEEERIDNLKEIATIYEFLQQKDPKRQPFYNEALQSAQIKLHGLTENSEPVYNSLTSHKKLAYCVEFARIPN